ncbi:MAG: GntR family transcriptional regulator [Clostridiales bacterium GWF2_36_10]|nr:MAG: GntR family transcriptional regulator [Clostridiales bacterium GWF2_36_10]HAN21045.1 PLP-dependent aminotransferase family protein [Clostridiales bacterium]
MNYTFSDKVKDMRPSAIREIFKSLSDPTVISFAAGNPSALSFPVEKMKNISEEIFLLRSTEALQYSVTEGYTPLRKQINDRLKERFSIGNDYNETIITTGGQQGIDLTAKVLCNEGDTIICENPSFIGALNAFRSYNTNLVGVELEDDGMNLVKLEAALKTNKNVRFIYIIPTFQNPSGITTSLEKRKAVLALAKRYDTLILEDNPYGELRYAGEEIPTMKSMDTEGRVIYCSSFSKILSAGMRVGFLCGHKDIIQKVVVAKQVNDVHTNIFFQMLASRFIDIYGLDEHIASIKELYKQKCGLMLSQMDEKFNKKIKYTRPEGGLFLWVTMPNVDADELAKVAIANKVAVVPGSTFCPVQGEKSRSFRLNYSTPTNEQIIDGIDKLAKIMVE